VTEVGRAFSEPGDARPPAPIFAMAHGSRTYRVELVPGSGHGEIVPGRAFWRVTRGRQEILVTMFRANESATELRLRIGELLT